MKLEKFIEKNKKTAIYKAAWNNDNTRLKFWFVDGTTASLKDGEPVKAKPRWIHDGETK